MSAYEICKQAWREYVASPSQDRLNRYHRYLVELTREELDGLAQWARTTKFNNQRRMK